VHTQACPLVHRGLGFSLKRALTCYLFICFYLLVFFLAAYTQKTPKTLYSYYCYCAKLVNQFLQLLVDYRKKKSFSWIRQPFPFERYYNGSPTLVGYHQSVFIYFYRLAKRILTKNIPIYEALLLAVERMIAYICDHITLY
jgi:hypothetical protein